MALLVALIVMVTLVFINLLVALIVTNLDELRTSGHIQVNRLHLGKHSILPHVQATHDGFMKFQFQLSTL